VRSEANSPSVIHNPHIRNGDMRHSILELFTGRGRDQYHCIGADGAKLLGYGPGEIILFLGHSFV